MSEQETYQKVLDWASTFVAEDERKQEDYLWPDEMRNLLEDLKHYRNVTKIAVLGIQGTGKTRACRELSNALVDKDKDEESTPTTISFKWPINGDWCDAIIPLEETFNPLRLAVIRNMVDEFVKVLKVNRHQMSKRIAQMDDRAYVNVAHEMLSQEDWGEHLSAREYLRAPVDLAERFLSQAKIKRIRKDTLIDELRQTQVILIDLPDYPPNGQRMLMRHLDQIQAFWADLGASNLILFFQKELLVNHFFLGKTIKIELKPFPPEKLVERYKQNFGSTYPFTSEALLEIASMSRGVFRRFKKYVYRCLSQHKYLRNEKEAAATLPISVEFVRETITFHDILEDMQSQLFAVFPKTEDQSLAVRILEHVRLHPDVNQTELARALEMDDMTLSRFLNKLQEYGYVRRERGEHGEKKLSFVHMCTGETIEQIFKDKKKKRTTRAKTKKVK